jgi:hypothetical protein
MPEWRVFSIVLTISIIDNIYKISDAIWITIGWYDFDNFTNNNNKKSVYNNNKQSVYNNNKQSVYNNNNKQSVYNNNKQSAYNNNKSTYNNNNKISI